MYYKKIPMFKIHFYIRGAEKAKPDDLCSIYYQLDIEGRPRDTPVSTKLRIPKKHWKNSGAVRTYVWAEEINNRLEQITRAFKDIFACLSIQQSDLSYQQIKLLYDGSTGSIKKPKPIYFFDVYDLMVSAKASAKGSNKNHSGISQGTVTNYRIRKTNLQQFFNAIHQPNPLITDISYDHIEQMLAYFPSSWSNGHRAKHAFAVNSTLEYAIKKKYLHYNPLGALSLPSDEDKPVKYLEPSMRANIKNINLPSLQKSIDICLFLWNTGLSYTDYLSLESSHIINTAEGPWFKKKRNKSSIYSMAPIMPEALAIIKKYGSVEDLPRPDLSDFNKLLKTIGDLAQVNTHTVGWNLSTSVFRKTFSSIMENELMLEQRTIMFMMGHKSQKTLSKYTHVRPERIAHELKRSGITFDKAS